MRKWVAPRALMLGLGLVILFPMAVVAQQPGSEDRIIDAFRNRSTIGTSDQGRLTDWVQTQIGKYSDFSAFRKRFNDQYQNSSNSTEFSVQFAAQTAQVAANLIANNSVSPDLAHALMQVLLDMNRVEIYPALISGASSSDQRVRYLAVKGLVLQKESIVPDAGKLSQTIQLLEQLGANESNMVILSRIYDALAYSPNQVAAVFNSYLTLFDKRLTFRRQLPNDRCDGAEIFAFEFFRQPAVLTALDADQKTQLALRIAGFLRLDAQRYATTELSFDELDKLERQLEGAESIFTQLVRGSGGKIINALSQGGHSNRQIVLQEAYRWVGDAQRKTRGALNEAPWNVPIGAP